MPQLGETVAEGKITKWFKTAGDAVKPVGYQAPADTTVTNQGVASIRPGLPPDWPDPRGLIPPPPVSQPAPYVFVL